MNTHRHKGPRTPIDEIIATSLPPRCHHHSSASSPSAGSTAGPPSSPCPGHHHHNHHNHTASPSTPPRPRPDRATRNGRRSSTTSPGRTRPGTGTGRCWRTRSRSHADVRLPLIPPPLFNPSDGTIKFKTRQDRILTEERTSISKSGNQSTAPIQQPTPGSPTPSKQRRKRRFRSRRSKPPSGEVKESPPPARDWSRSWSKPS